MGKLLLYPVYNYAFVFLQSSQFLFLFFFTVSFLAAGYWIPLAGFWSPVLHTGYE